MLALLFGNAQQVSRMKRGHQLDPVPIPPLAARFCYRLFGSEDALKSGRSQRDDYAGLYDGELAKEELLASRHFIAFRRAVAGRAALDDITYINVFAPQPYRRDNFIDNCPPAPERASVASRRPQAFADEDYIRVRLPSPNTIFVRCW